MSAAGSHHLALALAPPLALAVDAFGTNFFTLAAADL